MRERDFVLDVRLAETVSSCEAFLSVYLIKRLRLDERIVPSSKSQLR